MKTSENKNTSTIPTPDYYAAKRAQYAAEARDAKERPEKWPTVVSVTSSVTGEKVQVYTNVE